MSSKLQLTTLAVLVSAALPAQAALYKVVEVTDTGGVTGTEYYGTAIQPSDEALNASYPLGCFDSAVTGCEDYKLAGETRDRPDGFSYREEVPFAMDNSFGYIEDDYDGFEDYCFFQLGYATCEYWASDRWSSWSNETYGSDTPNSLAFIEGNAVAPTGAINTVINSFAKMSGAVSSITVGNYSNSTSRNTPLSGDTLTDTAATPITWKQGRQWASNDDYSVGSVSSNTGIDSERYNYYSKPAVWDKKASTLTAVAWKENDQQDGDYYAQGSMRDFYIDGTTFYGVGYNNYDEQHMNATIFKGITSNLAAIASSQINGAEVDAGDDNTNTNSVATNINKNLVVVGQAKRSGSYPQNGAAANRLFVVANANSPSAHFLDSTDGSIFFNGAGGEMGSINNYNEIVGRIDSENHREYDGKQRRQRAFIYAYNGTGTDADRRNIFYKDNKSAWLLDDLTNDGSTTGNNQYRIYDATDINDAGVISATAVMCPGGYDSTAHNAYCDDGNGDETVVAVKLVPIADEAQRNIEPRTYESTASERQGAGLGFGALTLLGLFGFMRKRIK